MDVTAVTNVNWQMSRIEVGGIIQGVDDINQCILNILTTTKGSEPLRPEFGVDLFRWVDKPISQAVPNLLREIKEAIEIWEPRIVLEGIGYEQIDNGVRFAITWRFVDEDLKQTIDYIYGIAS